ncbi:sugar ABC transporter substrate-binding protein [Priestia abyssalis]|uniref:sugar ABC transporter substrate-binding protein n=1 Tax=Priestia abyssalis TaxID=1221450 RepID=UPI0014740668|nr:sugar ABC transporter substrate-binding protein [Priestia abyssalis]
MKKRWMILLFCIFLLTVLIGCTVKLLKENDKPKVVVVLKELNTQYWNIVKAGVEKGFQDFGIDGKVIATRNRLAEEQDRILENVLREKPDVLIVSPLLSSNIPILKEFDKNNIPVLLVDTDAPWGNKTSYIGTDNFELGQKAGELLASQLQPGDKVAIIFSNSDLVHPVFSERIKGATFSLEGVGIKIVTEKLKLQNEPLAVKKAMTTILQKHPDTKGVFALNDVRALSALEVIEDHGYKMPVIGADGISELVELIGDGTLTGTVAQNPYDMGYISVEQALKIVKGELIEKRIDSGVDIIIKENAKDKLEFLKENVRLGK